MPERVRVDLENYSGEVVGTTAVFTSLNVDLETSDKGKIAVNLPVENPLYALIQEDYIWRVWYKWDEEGIVWTNIANGIHKTPVDSQLQNGRRTFASYAPTEEELLHKAYILYPSSASQADKSGAASSVIFEFVRENLGAQALVANGRDFNHACPISFGADAAEGPAWQGVRARKNLLTVLREIRQYSIDQGNQIDFRVTYQDGYTFLFECGNIHTDRTTDGLTPTSSGLNGAGNPPVIFSPIIGNVRRFTVSQSRYNEANVVVALGKGLGGSRLTGVASDGSSIATSPIAQRETVVNATDQDSAAQLNAVADSKLDELLSRPKISAIPRSSAILPFRDYFLGDFVTVEDFAGNRVNRQVVSLSLNVSYSEGGLVVDKDIRLTDE